jgi:hypothetical protein
MRMAKIQISSKIRLIIYTLKQKNRLPPKRKPVSTILYFIIYFLIIKGKCFESVLLDNLK